MVYYPALEREIAGRGIKKKDIAESIGVCYKALSNRMTGKTPFTWPEVCKIRNTFFPDMENDVLFSETMYTDFSNIATRDLVEELKKREGVKTTIAEPYQDVQIEVNGPAIVLVVVD